MESEKYEKWEENLHKLEESLREFYFVGETIMRHQDDGHPMMIVITVGETEEIMSERLTAVNTAILGKTT